MSLDEIVSMVEEIVADKRDLFKNKTDRDMAEAIVASVAGRVPVQTAGHKLYSTYYGNEHLMPEPGNVPVQSAGPVERRTQGLLAALQEGAARTKVEQLLLERMPKLTTDEAHALVESVVAAVGPVGRCETCAGTGLIGTPTSPPVELCPTCSAGRS